LTPNFVLINSFSSPELLEKQYRGAAPFFVMSSGAHNLHLVGLREHPEEGLPAELKQTHKAPGSPAFFK